MKRFLCAAAIAVALGLSTQSLAAPPNNIAQTVGICDPNSPTHCAAPDASGALPITGSLSIGGTQSNAASGVATSGVNGQQVAWSYGFNGTTWDQLQVDGSKFLKVVVSAALPTGANAIGSITNSSFNATGSTSNAASGVAAGAVSVPSVAYNYGFNGTTWDQLQVDASKFLKVNCSAGCSAAAATTPVVSSANEAGHILKASSGTLLTVSVTTGATGGFLMVSNTTTVPADGAVTPLVCAVAPAGQTTSWNSAASPMSFSTGISAYFSTTGCFTKTGSATAFITGQVQ